MRLGDLDALKEDFDCVSFNDYDDYKRALRIIDNASTVEVPENEVNCVLTMFGKCSYNETGCSDCEIKDKIRKILTKDRYGEGYAQGYIDGSTGADMRIRKGDENCMDEDAKQASIPYTYNAPQHDWKCGYPGKNCNGMINGGEEE